MQIRQDEQQTIQQEQYKLNEQQQKCIDTISSFEQFYNFKNSESLVRIFLSKTLSLAFFDTNKVEISSLFGGDQKQEYQGNRTQQFSKKYSFERLCEKFLYPKGVLTTFKKIVRHKFRSEYIESHNTRKNIWLLASGAKYCMKTYKGMYKALTDMTNYPQSYTRAIDLDINRTAAKESPQSMAAMRRMLIAFSRKNPYIGYCQGLNFIAYFILTMQFQQQQGFWLLSQLLQTIIPMDYYTNMIGVVTDQRIFLQILRQHSPKIAKKFQQVGLEPSVFTIQWFVCLFTSSVPFYLVQIIWDRLIIQGTSALLKTGIIILQQFQDQIMKATDFPDIIILVEQRSKKLSLSQLKFNLKYQNIYINKTILQLARDMYRQLYIKEKLAQKVVKGINKNLYKNIQCNRQWPVCLQVLERNKKQRGDCYVWTFKKLLPPMVTHNYLDSIEGDQKIPQIHDSTAGSFVRANRSYSGKLQSDPRQLVIGRMYHICPAIRQANTQSFPVLPKQQQSPQKSLSKSQVFQPNFQPGQQPQQQSQQVNRFSFLQTRDINAKKVQRLKKAQSMFFYQKFIFNNKQLGEIIANESIKQST